MIVVMIISLLAVLALPSFSRARINSQNVRFINDVRVATGAFQGYCMDHGYYPPDQNPGITPAGMAEYFKGIAWTRSTPIGGQWDWDCKVFGAKAAISVYYGNDTQDARMMDIDQKLDDGDLTTGLFRKRSQGYMYVIEWE
jgi:type II secretory pathway pseudopilin PulG